MVPAALIGIDTTRILRSAEAMAEHCSAASPPRVNPGVMLGLVLGCCQQAGRDKLTLVTPPPLAPFGAWLEQLIAESTGKQGRAIIPVDGEPAGPTEVYGHDRVFVQLRLAGAPEAKQDARMEVLRQAGHAVIQIDLTDVHDLGGEMFRWEIATAVAGSVMGIHPFDQPDVEASKIETRRLTSDWESKGRFPEETPLATCDGFRLYTDAANARALLAACAGDESAPALLAAHFRRVGPGDYVALLAYLNQHDGGHESVLGMMRKTLRNRLKVATCLGFGPRFLHSTGQAYKGGPASGVFLQFTCEEADELPVPGHRFGFGVVKAAQALGDFNVLAERGRRALRVHLSADTHAALASFEAVVNAALKRLDATAAAGQDDSSQPAIGC